MKKFLYNRYWGAFYDITSSANCPIIGVGFSGNQFHFNQPIFESLSKQGPLPENRYKLHYQETHPTLGPHVFRLEPIDNSPMFGRDEFYIHGDNPAANHTSSEGCIVTSLPTRSLFSDRDILVVV